MRLLLPVLISLFLLPCGPAQAAGIEFFHGNWEEALAKAEAEDKLIFVDAYASWCGPCKRMAASVFPLDEVGDFHNANFINVKFDMEKAESADFRKTHSVSAYPTLLYINAKNEVVHKSVGGKSGPMLINVGNEALAKKDNIADLTERYEAGERDPKFMLKYVRALARDAEQSHLKVANDYLRQPTGKLTEENNLRLILVAATEADSRTFDLLTKYRDEIVALEGEESFNKAVTGAVEASLRKAVQYNDEDLRKLAVKKMSAVDKGAAKIVALRGDYLAALNGSDLKEVEKAAEKYLDKGIADNEAEQRAMFAELSGGKFSEDPAIVDIATRAGLAAAAKSTTNGWRDYYLVAKYLMERDRNAQALEAAKQSLDALGEGRANYRRAIEGLVTQIEGRL